MPYSYDMFKKEITEYMYQYIIKNNITKILDLWNIWYVIK